MSVKVLYSTSATATGGRDGSTSVDDGSLSVQLSTPKELGGSGSEGNNPEQLFAAGYAACFLSATRLVAGKQGIDIPDDAHITAKVGIGPNDQGGFGLAVELVGSFPGVENPAELMTAAHEVCPYSNATRGNIDVELSLA